MTRTARRQDLDQALLDFVDRVLQTMTPAMNGNGR
jgi:hypothetical protein